jgi:hypothetical protein
MAVLTEPQRLATARRARRALAAMPMPLDAIATLAARLTGAPMAIGAVLDVAEPHFVGSHGMPQPLAGPVPVPAAYSVCKYIVSADRAVAVPDMSADADLREHGLVVEYGARAFAGVPLRDSADRTVGALLVVDTVARVFTEEHVQRLTECRACWRGCRPRPGAPIRPRPGSPIRPGSTTRAPGPVWARCGRRASPFSRRTGGPDRWRTRSSPT